jgi:hypothetical protein
MIIANCDSATGMSTMMNSERSFVLGIQLMADIKNQYFHHRLPIKGMMGLVFIGEQ